MVVKMVHPIPKCPIQMGPPPTGQRCGAAKQCERKPAEPRTHPASPSPHPEPYHSCSSAPSRCPECGPPSPPPGAGCRCCAGGGEARAAGTGGRTGRPGRREGAGAGGWGAAAPAVGRPRCGGTCWPQDPVSVFSQPLCQSVGICFPGCCLCWQRSLG